MGPGSNDVQIERSVVFKCLDLQRIFHFVCVKSINTLESERVNVQPVFLSGLPVGQDLVFPGDNTVGEEDERSFFPDGIYFLADVDSRGINAFQRFIESQRNVTVQIQTGRCVYTDLQEFGFNSQCISFFQPVF